MTLVSEVLASVCCACNRINKICRMQILFSLKYIGRGLHWIKKTDVILIFHDNDATIHNNAEWLSHILYPIDLYYNRKGLDVSIVMSPFSTKNQSNYSRYYNYNLVSLIAKAIRLPFRMVGLIRCGKVFEDSLVAWAWQLMIRRARPSVIIGIQPENGVCIAGYKCGIPVVDYQHGVISREHPSYSPAFFESRQVGTIPSVYCVWSDYYKSLLETSIGHKHATKVYSCGKPKIVDKKIYGNQIERIEALSSRFSGALLLTLQPDLNTIRTDPYYNGLLLDSIVSTIKLTERKYFWLIRFHPIQLNPSRYHQTEKMLRSILAGCNNYEYSDTSSVVLELLFDHIDLHITDYSSVIIEAAMHGIKSAILNEFIRPGAKFESYYEFERNNGMAEVLSNDSRILYDWIEKNMKPNPDKLVHCKAEQGFDKDLLFLDDLIAK